MNKRITTLISSLFNSFCDFTLDIAVNQFDTYKVLFYTSAISLFFQLLYALKVHPTFSLASLPFILLYGFIILLGYLFYIKALQKLPIGLIALTENLDLFLVLIIDLIIGYITFSFHFIFIFIIFIFSIFWFAYESNKIHQPESFKNIQWQEFIYIIISIICYTMEPYLIKIASYQNANEVAINLGYSLFALPFFWLKSRKASSSPSPLTKKGIILIILIGLFESIYYITSTIGFISESPIMVNIIQELRVFLLIILSVIFKTDKMTLPKWCAMILGMGSILMIALTQ